MTGFGQGLCVGGEHGLNPAKFLGGKYPIKAPWKMISYLGSPHRKLPQFPFEFSIEIREKMERFAAITPITSANGF
jgi:hypothetical protein